MAAFHLRIKGKVQGVFFRATAKEKAGELGITGWIKNTSEGDVEAIICGETLPVQKFIDWCKTGPKNAKVTEVQIEEISAPDVTSFKILR